ncbi:MAG: Hint domain-containing protein [Pseudorhodobacter sp.]
MPVQDTYPVYYLGTAFDLDFIEGNPTAEFAALLLAAGPVTYGSTANPLSGNVHQMAPVGSPGSYYRTNNNSYNDQFSIDGGSPRTFDSVVHFNATITYTDGTPPATISAVVFQDTDGRLYLAPERFENSDQLALDAAPLQSITLNSVINNSHFGMDVERFVCFGRGTLIDTQDGPTPVECLKAGDLIRTVDNGFQPLCWIGSQAVAARDNLAAVHIAAGVLGNRRELVVSQQHRILVDGQEFGCVEGPGEYFIPAKKLVDGNRIRLREEGTIEYFHLLLDQHQVVYSEGIPTESFYLGPQAWLMLPEQHRQDIIRAMPELCLNDLGAPLYGPLARPVGHLRRNKRTEGALAA